MLIPQRATSRAWAEKLFRFAERLDEHIHFVARVVEIKAGAGRRVDAEFLVQRHRAMVAGADGDAVLVEKRGEIVRVNVAEGERHQAAAFFHVERAVEDDLDEVLEAVDGVLGDLLFVLADFVQADALQVIDRDAEADGFGDVGSAGLKFVG